MCTTLAAGLHNVDRVQHCRVATNHTIWKGDFEGTMSDLEALQLEAAGSRSAPQSHSTLDYPLVPSGFWPALRAQFVWRAGYGLDNQNSIPD
jgi:hypothetical protein